MRSTTTGSSTSGAARGTRQAGCTAPSDTLSQLRVPGGGTLPLSTHPLVCIVAPLTGSSRLDSTWPCSETSAAVCAPAASTATGAAPVRRGTASRVGTTEWPSSFPTAFVHDAPTVTLARMIHYLSVLGENFAKYKLCLI